MDDKAQNSTPKFGLKARLIFYSVNLYLAVTEMIMGGIGGAFLKDAWSAASFPFAIYSAAIGLITTILHSVLLAFCNRPNSTHLFSRVKFHVYSLVVAAFLRIVAGIMYIAISPANCDLKTYSDGMAYLWCSWSIAEAVLSLVCAGLMILTAWLLYAPIRAKRYDMDMNIAV